MGQEERGDRARAGSASSGCCGSGHPPGLGSVLGWRALCSWGPAARQSPHPSPHREQGLKAVRTSTCLLLERSSAMS